MESTYATFDERDSPMFFVREKFYNIPDARRLIAARTLKLIGKLGRELCNGAETIPAELLSSWVNNKRLVGGQSMTNKRTIVKHLKLLYGKSVEDISQQK